MWYARHWTRALVPPFPQCGHTPPHSGLLGMLFRMIDAVEEAGNGSCYTPALGHLCRAVDIPAMTERSTPSPMLSGAHHSDIVLAV